MLWQFCPGLISLFGRLCLMRRPRRLHNSSGYRTVQATYIFLFIICAVLHIRTLANYKFDPRTIMNSWIPPWICPTPGNPTRHYLPNTDSFNGMPCFNSVQLFWHLYGFLGAMWDESCCYHGSSSPRLRLVQRHFPLERGTFKPSGAPCQTC